MKRLILALVMVVMVSPAWGSFDGNHLYEWCEETESSTTYYSADAFCKGYITGVIDSVYGAEKEIYGFTFCIPKNAQLEQVKDVVFSWLKANPAKRHFIGGSLVATALSEAWPCP
jgi:hypothetical protein